MKQKLEEEEEMNMDEEDEKSIFSRSAILLAGPNIAKA